MLHAEFWAGQHGERMQFVLHQVQSPCHGRLSQHDHIDFCGKIAQASCHHRIMSCNVAGAKFLKRALGQFGDDGAGSASLRRAAANQIAGRAQCGEQGGENADSRPKPDGGQPPSWGGIRLPLQRSLGEAAILSAYACADAAMAEAGKPNTWSNTQLKTKV